jgi:DNA-binding transcriptional ArsR family regulator
MDFEQVSSLSSHLAKDYASDIFRLLVNYQDISASEAASRLGLHIRTAQDYLDGLSEHGIVEKTEVHERKRPYYRYNLLSKQIQISVDLSQFEKADPGEGLGRLVRERQNASSNFSIARSGDHFSSVTIWEGMGREREERKISLTTPQGKFLFHLPFPQSRPMSISEIMEKAGVEEEYAAEIQDIVDELVRFNVIEVI